MMVNKEALYELCKEFIRDQEITVSETIYQCDWVAENSLELIEKICNIVGYHTDKETD